MRNSRLNTMRAQLARHMCKIGMIIIIYVDMTNWWQDPTFDSSTCRQAGTLCQISQAIFSASTTVKLIQMVPK